MSGGKRAFLFPGQGSQYMGMAADLYQASPAARALLEKLQDATGFDLLRVMLEGPEEELRQTQNAQPALMAHSLAALELLREAGVEADTVAGHSLGEYTALVAAGALAPEDGIRLVRRRGELMARAGDDQPGAMAAVIGMEADALQAVLDGISSGIVVIANYNCPGQLVISGTPEAVAEASAAAKRAGAHGAVPLKVSGAFHSPLMAPVAEEFAASLEQVGLGNAQVPVYCNVDALPHRTAAELRDCLRRQLTGAVLWEASIRRMIAAGVTKFVEVGPKDVLTRMMPRIDGSVCARAVGAWQDFEAVV